MVNFDQIWCNPSTTRHTTITFTTAVDLAVLKKDTNWDNPNLNNWISIRPTLRYTTILTTDTNWDNPNLNNWISIFPTLRYTTVNVYILLNRCFFSSFVPFLLAVFVTPYTNNLSCETRLFYAACGRTPQQITPQICPNDVETNEKERKKISVDAQTKERSRYLWENETNRK